MLQLARQTALQNESKSSEGALPGLLSRQSTAPLSYRSRQNTVEASPSHSDSQIPTPRQIVPPRRPVARTDAGAFRHPELRGNRITEFDERSARRNIPRRRPVPTPAAGAINPILLRELQSAGRDDEETLVGSEPRSPPPRSLAQPRTSGHAPIQSSSASRRTSGPTQHSQQTLQHDREPRPQQTRPRREPKSPPAQQPGNPEQTTRPTRQETARQSDMAPYTAPGGGGTGRGSQPYQQSQGGNYPPGGGGRASAQAGTRGLPPSSPSNPLQNTQGARGGQRLSNTNARLRHGAGMVAGTLNSWDEKAQETSPYTAALMMTVSFATIWGIGLITFGLVCK